MVKQLAVLYIDDDVEDVEIFEEALYAVDHSIRLIKKTCCSDAVEFLDSTGKLPDFIFLDYNMPKVNGLHCLPEIKRLCGVADTTIMVYSSWVDDGFIEIAMSLGAFGVFKKPFSFDDIVSLIRLVISNR